MSPSGGAHRSPRQQLLLDVTVIVGAITFYVIITCAAWYHAANLSCSPAQLQIPGLNKSLGNFKFESMQEQSSPVLVASLLGDPSYHHWFSPPQYETVNSDDYSAPPAAEYTSFPKQKRWIDLQPYVDRGASLLEGIETQCTWPTFYWDYETLEEDGYEIDYHQGQFHDTWDQFLQDIGVAPRSDVIEWGCSRSTNRVDSEGMVFLDGGYAIQLNLQAGIMVMTYTYRPMEAPPGSIINLSDVIYLAWQEMASIFAPGQNPKPKYFLVEGIANMETINIVRNCIGGTANQFSVTAPAWPGRLWSMQERCGKALLGSPSGRALGFLLAQHLEVPEGATGADEAIPMKGISITAARVFDVDNSEMNLIFYLGQLQQPQQRDLIASGPGITATSCELTDESAHARTLSDHGDKLPLDLKRSQNDITTKLQHEQKRVPYDYSRWLERGERILEAVRSHCTEKSRWTDPSSLQAAGYSEVVFSQHPEPHTWAGFLTQAGIDRDFEFSDIAVRRAVDVDPETGREFWDGRYQFLFDHSNGVFIMLATFRAQTPARGTVVNLSDILYLAWKKDMMRNLITDGTIKYYCVDDIINASTKEIIASACALVPVPRWPGKDFDIDSDCGKAVLGSPSGIALGYLLAQHQDDFPDTEIGYVKIFDNAGAGWPNLVFYCGPKGNLPRSSGRVTSDSSAARSLSKRASLYPEVLGANAYPPNKTLIKRITLYEGCRNRGQNFIDAIDAQDTCSLPPTQFPDYSALAIAGYEPGASDYFADPVWKKFLEDAGGDGATRCVRWRCFREVSAGPPADDVMVNDGIFIVDFQLELGIMIMDNTYRASDPTPNTIKQLSDIVFLGWQHTAHERGVLNPTIKWFCVDSVVNRMTDNVVFEALATKGKYQLEAYPGVKFSVDDADGGDAFYAILGTPSGRGIAWMIINHASALPRKTIQSVKAFRCSTHGSLLCLIFEVVDMPPAEPGLGDIDQPPAFARELGIAAPAA